MPICETVTCLKASHSDMKRRCPVIDLPLEPSFCSNSISENFTINYSTPPPSSPTSLPCLDFHFLLSSTPICLTCTTSNFPIMQHTAPCDYLGSLFKENTSKEAILTKKFIIIIPKISVYSLPCSISTSILVRIL